MSSTTGLVNQDPFNIMKKYPDSRRNPQWFTLPTKVLDFQDPSFMSRIKSRLDLYDRLVAVTDSTGLNIDYWEIDNNINGFLAFLTSAGKNDLVDCTITHATLSDRGYIYSANDWLNTEGTIFIKVKSLLEQPGIEPSITLKCRTGFHPGNTFCCQGAAYGTTLYPRLLLIELFREVYHDLKITKDRKTPAVTSLINNYFGLKFCVYNQINNGTKEVVNEVFMCPDTLTDNMMYNWKPVLRRTDFAGANWARGGKKCGANFDDGPLDWAGPRAIFQWEGFSKLIFKYASWREIEPKISFRTGGHQGGKRPAIISCEPGKHYDFETGTCVPDAI